jgi:hypothetical protein
MGISADTLSKGTAVRGLMKSQNRSSVCASISKPSNNSSRTKKPQQSLRLRHMRKNLARRRGEFWNWHYPVHWDDIFRTTLRSSALLSVMSFAETNVTHICTDVESIARTPIRIRDLDRRDGVWNSSKLFLEAFGNFTEPGPDIWEAINHIYAIRNLFAHNDGVPRENEERRFEMIATSVPGFSKSNGQYGIGTELIPYVLDTMSSFFRSLSDQLHGLCARVKSFERDSH